LQRIEQLAEINSLYENDKKANEVNLLIQDNKLKDLQINQNRYLILGLSGLALLVFMIIVMMIRQRRLRARQNALDMEQMLLRSQMNPHFIFNALTNIQSFIVRKDSAHSLHYLDIFLSMMETILDSSGKKFIPLSMELETISNYFTLQQLRIGNKLNYEIKVDENLDPLAVMLPPMMVQPLIENAIEHGIKPKEGMGRVEVRFKKRESELSIEVEDDGIGRSYKKDKTGTGNHSHAGLALVILKERLESLRSSSFEIRDLKDADGIGRGTIAILVLPLIKTD
jgi:sensor histidine kinase YesM